MTDSKTNYHRFQDGEYPILLEEPTPAKCSLESLKYFCKRNICCIKKHEPEGALAYIPPYPPGPTPPGHAISTKGLDATAYAQHMQHYPDDERQSGASFIERVANRVSRNNSPNSTKSSPGSSPRHDTLKSLAKYAVNETSSTKTPPTSDSDATKYNHPNKRQSRRRRKIDFSHNSSTNRPAVFLSPRDHTILQKLYNEVQLLCSREPDFAYTLAYDKCSPTDDLNKNNFVNGKNSSKTAKMDYSNLANMRNSTLILLLVRYILHYRRFFDESESSSNALLIKILQHLRSDVYWVRNRKQKILFDLPEVLAKPPVLRLSGSSSSNNSSLSANLHGATHYNISTPRGGRTVSSGDNGAVLGSSSLSFKGATALSSLRIPILGLAESSRLASTSGDPVLLIGKLLGNRRSAQKEHRDGHCFALDEEELGILCVFLGELLEMVLDRENSSNHGTNSKAVAPILILDASAPGPFFEDDSSLGTENSDIEPGENINNTFDAYLDNRENINISSDEGPSFQKTTGDFENMMFGFLQSSGGSDDSTNRNSTKRGQKVFSCGDNPSDTKQRMATSRNGGTSNRNIVPGKCPTATSEQLAKFMRIFANNVLPFHPLFPGRILVLVNRDNFGNTGFRRLLLSKTGEDAKFNAGLALLPDVSEQCNNTNGIDGGLQVEESVNFSPRSGIKAVRRDSGSHKKRSNSQLSGFLSWRSQGCQKGMRLAHRSFLTLDSALRELCGCKTAATVMRKYPILFEPRDFEYPTLGDLRKEAILAGVM